MGKGRPMHEISVTVNGQGYSKTVPARQLLIHFLRDELGLRGPKIGCDTGHCGACTIKVDGSIVKSCMLLAVQGDGTEIETVESLSEDGELNALQQAFNRNHSLQCGYCTSGMLMSASFLLERDPDPTEEAIREHLHGNVCRCTGYVNIVKAVMEAAQEVKR